MIFPVGVGKFSSIAMSAVAMLIVSVLLVGSPGTLAAAAPAEDGGSDSDPVGGPLDPVDVAEERSTLKAASPLSSVPLTDSLGTAFNLGLAAESSAITGAAFDAEGAWVVTRSQVPAALYRWDHDAGAVTRVRDLPIGSGSWASLQLGSDPRRDDVLVGTATPGGLVTYSPSRDSFTRTVRLKDAEIVMGMALRPDGTVAVGTYHPSGGRLLLYRPSTGDVTTLATWAEHRYVRSVAVVGDAIYAGLGMPASLWRWQDGRTSRVDTPGLDEESLVYSLATDGTTLYGGTEPGAQVFSLASGQNSPDSFRIVADTPAKTVDTLAVSGDALFFTARPEGGLHRIDLAGESAPTRVALPMYGSETRQLQPTTDGVYGITGTADLWRVSGEVEVTHLTDHGAPQGPDAATQGINYWGSRIVVGGHWRVHQHSPDGAGSTPVRVPGEPKVTVSQGEDLYAAVYPGAEVHRLNGSGSDLVARIPGEQMRPRAMIWHASSSRLLVSTRPAYGRFGGDLTLVDPATGELTSYVRPFGDSTVTAMQDWGGDVVVGTETYGEAEGTAPGAGPAYVARWSPSGSVRWKRAIDGSAMITSVTQVRIGTATYVLASSENGTVALLDPDSGRVMWTKDLGGSVDQLSTVAGRTIGRVDGRLHELHPTLRTVTTVRLLDHTVRWAALDPRTGNSFAAVAPAVDGSPVLWRGELRRAPRPERLGGANRFDTAAEVSTARFGRAGTAVLVRYDDFADVLAAAPLASRLGAPVLYTRTGSLDAATAREIDRLGARRITIVGGTGAVSAGVEQTLRSRGISVSRIGGADRYATAAAVAARVAAIDGGAPKSVFLVTGLDFPDGLSAAPAATLTDGVVLLTKGAGLPPATRDAVARYRTAALYTVGGPAQQAAKAAGLRPSATLTGADRYATSVLVAQRWFPSPENVYLTNGMTFADALVAASPAGREAAPVLLTRSDALSSGTRTYIRGAAPEVVLMIGGSGVVSDRVWTQVRQTYL